MWKALLCALFVAAASAEHGWKSGSEYKYLVRGRTLTALHQVANQYAGVLMRAHLTVQPKSENLLAVKVSNAEYAKINQQLPAGWGSRIPDNELDYQPLPISSKPFQMKLKNGAIDELVVSKSVRTWEVNLLKGIASQFQIDTMAENLISSRINNKPSRGSVNGIYKTMEDDVNGECEVLYDISPLPQYQLQSRPELAPLPLLRGDGQLIDVVKTKNFSHCEQRPGYHFGFNALLAGKPASSKLGEFMARSAISRVILSGSLQRYTIQSSVTTNKVILSPELYNKQKGMVVSRMNMTLESVTSVSRPLEAPSNSRKIKDLVYNYNDPFSTSNNAKPEAGSDSRSDVSLDSSSSSESQEHLDRMLSTAAKRFRRSMKNQEPTDSSSEGTGHQKTQKWNHGQDSSSSSSSSERNELQWGKRQNVRANHRNSKVSSSSSKSDFDSFSSWGISTSEEWLQFYPKMNEAPKIPMLPFFIGNLGSSIKTSSQLSAVDAVQKIASQIGQELQKPSQIPKKATLAKFTILARLVRIMDVKEIEQAARELYAPAYMSVSHSHSSSSKNSAWEVFRDAVAQAGTGPALIVIKNWIETGTIKGEVAAEILSVIPETARTPTREYMDTFFSIIKNSKVQNQLSLNSSATLSFTNLIRRALVDDTTAYVRYPTHVFGRLNPKKASAVVRDYIPYLANRLSSAVQDGDSHKIQVYIRALGNTAHHKIIDVFKPYFEGETAVSTFQRLHMTVALNKLAKVAPKVARPVLFRIYQNSGDAAEIRSAAVFLLMKTNPPASMLQRMAEFTNEDPSQQVRSAVKSAIESAAHNLDSQNDRELTENARAAVDILNTTASGLQYSKVNLKSNDVDEMNLAYQAAFATIGSDDSYVPSAAFISTRANLGGFQANYLRVGAMFSSVSDMTRLVTGQFRKFFNSRLDSFGKNSNTPSSDKWSSEKIAKMLNIKGSQAEQVEANFLINILSQQRFFAIDNHTVEQIPEYLEKAAGALKSGSNFNYTKLYNRYSMTMGFPTSMGLPLTFTLNAPTIVRVGGEARLRTQPDIHSYPEKALKIPKAINASAEVHFIYSTRTEAKLGFVTPFDHQLYIAGLDKDVLVNLPIRTNLDIDLQSAQISVKLQPINLNEDFKIFHLSAQPFTAKHDILDLAPTKQKPIQLRKQPAQANFTVGQDTTGMAFRIDGAYEGDFADFATVYDKIKNYDVMSWLMFPTTEQSIKSYELAISFDHVKTSAKSVTLTAAYDSGFGGNSDKDNFDGSVELKEDLSAESKNSQTAVNPSSSEPNCQIRRKQFLRRVSSGIRSANTSVIDLSAQFNGNQKAQFIATAAYANSNVDEKSCMLLYLRKMPARSSSDNKEQQATFIATAKLPNVSAMNYQRALNANIASQVTAQATFGEKLDSSASKVTIQVHMKQTTAFKDFIRHQPMSQLCENQMKSGNYFLPACQNATAQASMMDLYTTNIQFDKISQRLKNATYKAYAAVRHLGWQYNFENIVNPRNSHSSSVQLELRFAPNMASTNISLNAPSMSAEFQNVRLNPWIARAAVTHPTYSRKELLIAKALKGGYPRCVIDQTAASTFDNKTFPLSLGNNWHVMMQSVPKVAMKSGSSNHENLFSRVSVLVRDSGSLHGQREVKVIVNDNVFDFEAASGYPNIKYNSHPISMTSSKTSLIKDKSGSVVAEVSPQPAGTIKVLLPLDSMEVMFDGTRIALEVGQTYRGQSRGLCGTFDGEEANDFTAPRNCVLKNPQEFSASWAINPSGSVKEQQQKSLQAACYPVRVLYGGISDNEAGRFQRRYVRSTSRVFSDESKSSSQSSSDESSSSELNVSQMSATGCTTKRVKVVKSKGKICFSLNPQVTCGDDCQPSKKIPAMVDFHCVHDRSVAHHWIDLIKRGANPDFSQRGSTHTLKIDVPERCLA